MKRIVLVVALFLVAVAALSACGAARSEPVSDQGYAVEETSVGLAMPESPVNADVVMAGNTGSTPDLDQLQQTRKIIYDANMTIIVDDTEASVKAITDMAEGLGGYVATINGYRQENSMVYDITIRVPADQFETGLSTLRGMAVRVESESLGTEDVTDQYYDLDARLKTMKEAEAELTELLRQTREQGGDVEDVMAIYDRLIQMRADIESLQGQLNRLEKLVAFSTISLHLEPSVLSKPIEGGWHPAEIVRSSLDTLVDVLAGLGSFLIWFTIVVVPVMVILILPLIVLVWLIHRWQKRRQAAKES
jgi:predicted small secreted protein